MPTATARPLMDLNGCEIMSRDVVALPKSMSLEGAARRLSQSKISGAPVVDSEGRCVGVLSTNDFVSWVEKGDRAAKRHVGIPKCLYKPWQIL